MCLRSTIESVRQYHGNHMCWRRLGQNGRPVAGTCPHYGWKRISHTVHGRCYRTLCPDPCESNPCLNGGTCIAESVEEYSCLCPLGYRADQHCGGGKYLIPSGLLGCTVDLLFLIDGSWASGVENFGRAKDFIRRFTLFMNACQAETVLAVAQYSDSVVMEIPAGRHGGPDDFLADLEAVAFRGGVTRTGAALEHVVENTFHLEEEGGFRSEAPHVVVLLTGAKSKDQVSPAVEKAKQREIFVLAVAPSRMHRELIGMTSDPEVVFTYDNAQELHGKVQELRTKVCGLTSAGCSGKTLDLVFVLDSSAGASRDDFRLAKSFVRAAVPSFDLDADLTQVSVVMYGAAKPRTVFGLSDFDSEAGMRKAMGLAPYLGGAPPASALALRHVMDNILGAGNGARPRAQKVVVLLISEQNRGIDDNADLVKAADALRGKGAALLVIAPGSSQSSQGLLRIAGSARMTLAVPSYEDLNLYVDDAVQRICGAERRRSLAAQHHHNEYDRHG